MHKLEFEVRDYECDLQGIVNNANYQHYYEHARHTYLKSIGLSFSEMHKQGIDPVVYKIEIEFKKTLTSCDTFIVETMLTQESPLKYIFNQHILKDNKIINKAKVTIVFTFKGKPIVPPSYILEKLDL